MSIHGQIGKDIIEVLSLDVGKKNKFYIKDGDKYTYINHFGSKYDMTNALTAGKIFTTKTVGGKIKKSPTAGKGRLRDRYKRYNNAQIAAIIYGEYLLMVARDVLAGDIVSMKTSGAFPKIHIGYLSEELSLKLLIGAKGNMGVDARKVDYKLPKFVIDFGPKSAYKDRILQVPKPMYKQMLDNISAGKRYVKVPAYRIKTK